MKRRIVLIEVLARHASSSFYGTIYVPPEVWKEVSSERKPFGAIEAKQAREDGWLIVQRPHRLDRIQSLAFNLQPGETEALA